MGNLEVISEQITSATEALKKAREDQIDGRLLKLKDLLVSVGSDVQKELADEIDAASKALETHIDGNAIAKEAQLAIDGIRTQLDKLRGGMSTTETGKETTGKSKEEPNLFDKARNYIGGFFSSAGGVASGAAVAGWKQVVSGWKSVTNGWESAKNFFAFKFGSSMRDVRSMPIIGGMVENALSLIGVDKVRMNFTKALRSVGFTSINTGGGERLDEILEDARFTGSSGKNAMAVLAQKLRTAYPEPATTITYKEIKSVLDKSAPATKVVKPGTKQEVVSDKPITIADLPSTPVVDVLAAGIEIGGKTLSIESSPAVIVYGGRRWKMEHKVHGETFATFTIDKAEWTGTELKVTVTGKPNILGSITGYIGRLFGGKKPEEKTSTGTTSGEELVEFLEHLRVGTGAYALKNADKTDSEAILTL